MSLIARRLRSVLIALAVLALSATAVLAGRSALTAPAAPAAAQPAVDDDARAGEEGKEVELDEPTGKDDEGADEEAGDEGAPDADAETAGEHPDNHGKLVSEAAKTETPAGFDSHGAWVRSVAKDNRGHSDAATSQRADKKNR